MSGGVVEVGDKLHIITRRLFENDIRRHFVGEVIAVSGDLCEISGYVFVFNLGTNEYQKRPEPRKRIFSLGQHVYIINKMPREVVIESLHYRFDGRNLVVTDGRSFSLDIREFGAYF